MQTQRVLKWEELTATQKSILFRHYQVWRKPTLTVAEERWLVRQLYLTQERRLNAMKSVKKGARL